MNSTMSESYQYTWLETQWEDLYRDRNHLLVTGVLAFVMHEVVYFGRFLPFLACDYIPFFEQYKIQQNKVNTSTDIWKCVRQVVFQHFFFEAPLIFFFHPMASTIGMNISAPFPEWKNILPQIVIFFIFEDGFHYAVHRLMHWPPLYKSIHKVHHEYSAPFGIAAEYAHPLETSILGFGTIGGPLIYHAVTKYFLESGPEWQLHLFTMLFWIVCRLCQAIDCHSGYDFPWSLRHFIPFWAGADHHDYHHQMFIGNYASSFRWWDYIFGTDKKYREHRKRQALEKRKLKAT